MPDSYLANLTEREQRVLSHITEERWLALATELIKAGQPDACNPLDPDIPAGREEGISNCVADKLRAMGLTVETYSAEPHRPNIVSTLAGAAAKPSLILNDHLDTYPVMAPERWKKTVGGPFNATRHGGELYARGTSDTRGNLACTLMAVEAILAERIELEGTLHCVYTVDEEKNGPKGSMYLLNEIGITADYEITAEPTAWGDPSGDWGMALSVANSGNCLVEITVEGIKSHIWRPDTGANAIAKMAEIIPHIVAMPFTHAPADLMGHTPPCAAVVRVRGGLAGEMQFTPDVCTLILAVVGIVPGMTIEGVLADVEAEIARTIDLGDSYSVAVRQVPGSLFVNGTEPVSAEAEPCASLREIYRRMMGKEPVVNRKNAFNDTIRFNEAGIAAVTFGPGEDGWSPDDEAIWIDKAVMAAKIYALTVMQILGVRS